MKNIIISAACVLFAATGFSQSVEAKNDADVKSASCAKGKSACCAHASKSCADKKETAKVDKSDAADPNVNATFISTEPKKNKNSATDKTSPAS